MREDYFTEGHFRPNAETKALAELFRTSVENINLEITSFCNRRCGYCPVSKVDRHSKSTALTDERFQKILSNLKEIEYAGRINLNLYNEPTADKDLLLKRVAELRSALPSASVYFGTNGDYLDRDYVRELGQAGVSELYVTLHPPAGESYTDEYAIWRFTEFAARLGKPVKIDLFRPGHTIQGRFSLHKVSLNVFSTNYDQYGTDRAGSITALTTIARQRTSPCNRPFNDFTVSYDGTIFPCCQMFADDPRHKQSFAIGNIDQYRTIFHAYGSEAMTGWRRSLLTYGPKESPCSTCTEASTEQIDPMDRDMRTRVWQKFVGEQDAAVPTGAEAHEAAEPARSLRRFFTLFRA